MKNFFFNPRYYFNGPGAVGILILRVFVGYAMATHGLQKIQGEGGFFGWMGEGVPAFLQGLATFAEFFGGIAIMFGVLTPLACLAVMSVMFVATMSTIGKSGGSAYFVAPPSPEKLANYESSAMYFIFALVIFLTGPGLLSVDAALTHMMGFRTGSGRVAKTT